MKKSNIPLIIGTMILIVILIVMIFPELFTSKSPYFSQKIIFSTEEGKLLIDAAPHPPSKDFLLGSDDMGRDILSYIIYGTRLTIILGILVAIGRFLTAAIFAFNAGFGNGMAKSIIRQFNIIFSAIPALLISVIILKLDFFISLNKTNSIIAFVIVLSAIGWPKLGNLIMERVDDINQRPFIKGEIAIGKKRLKIALENVIPHIAPEMIVLFFMEIARSLSMIMQLGIFSVFIGNLKIIKDTEGGISFFNVSFEPEWASMLSTSRTMISAAPWAVIFPAIAFFISVLGFNLFGEGLRNIMQKKNSSITPALRKMISLDLKHFWRSFDKKKKIRSTMIAATLIIVCTFILFFNKDDHEFVLDIEKEITYDQVMIGTSASREISGIIADKMNDLGIEPMNDEGYISNYEIERSCEIIDHDFHINLGGEDILPERDRDYSFITAGDLDREGMVYDSTGEDLFNIDDHSKFNNKFVLIDKTYYNEASINYFIEEISKHAKIKGIILIARNNEKIRNHVVNKSEDIFVLLISKDLSKKIKDSNNPLITISASVKLLDNTGTNVVGIYKGSDRYIGDEAIVIGMGYNYLDENGKKIFLFNLEIMEKLCTLYGNKRSIIFMFLDGTMSDKYHGIYDVSTDFPYSPSKVQAYIDLTGLETPLFDQVKFSSAQAPFTRQFAWSTGRLLEKELNKNKIMIKELDTVNIDREYYFTESPADNVMFWVVGTAAIILSTEEAGQEKHSIKDVGKILIDIINESNY